MSNQIWITVDDAEVQAGLNELARRLDSMEHPLQLIGDHLLTTTRERFDTSRGPDGEDWPKLNSAYAAAKAAKRPGAKILEFDGLLSQSINYSISGSALELGPSHGGAYAAIHQFGGKTKPHDIKPKGKHALAFDGRVLSVVHHPGSDIPARPYLGISTDDRDAILDILDSYLTPDN